MSPQYTVQCERELAFESPDYLVPWGTRITNSSNQIFNKKLYGLFRTLYFYEKHPYFRIITLMDLGCGGGGFVESIIEDGHIAVGLEGSDFSKKHKRGAWATKPDHLFTCDIARDFQVFSDSSPLKFDVITCWEVMEHIDKVDLQSLCENVKKHLKEDGVWIMSISNFSDIVNGVELHQTRMPREWWIEFFRKFGFIDLPEYVRFFSPQFVCGRKETKTDFHLVLCLDRDKVPSIPDKKVVGRFMNRWHGSRPQKKLRELIEGPKIEWGR